MNHFAAFPAWLSAALLTASVIAIAVGASNPEQDLAWQVLLLLVRALSLSSFVAALVAAQKVWRASAWLSLGYILVSLFSSWCLYVGQLTIAVGIDGGGHPVGFVIGAAIGFLFIPASGVAAGVAAVKGDAAGFSRRTKMCGLAAGVISVSGLILVIPVSQMLGVTYGFAIAFLVFAGTALMGWWIGIGATAHRARMGSAPTSP